MGRRAVRLRGNPPGHFDSSVLTGSLAGMWLWAVPGCIVGILQWSE